MSQRRDHVSAVYVPLSLSTVAKSSALSSVALLSVC